MDDMRDLADQHKNKILLAEVSVGSVTSVTTSPKTIFQLYNPLYWITVDEPDNPLSCLYDHGYFWQLGIGYVRAFQFQQGGKPWKVLTLPRTITDIVEREYKKKDKEYTLIGPWPDVLLSVIMRVKTRLLGKKVKHSQVVATLKTLLREVINEDINIDILVMARTQERGRR